MAKRIPSELQKDHESRQVVPVRDLPYAMPSGPPDAQSLDAYRHYFGQVLGALAGKLERPVDVDTASQVVEEAGKLARLAVQTERLNMTNITK